MVKQHTFAVLASFLTAAGTVVILTSLQREDPTLPRCGWLLLFLSLPVWIAAEVRRALGVRGQQIEDAHTAAFYEAAEQLQQLASDRPAPMDMPVLDPAERHDR